MDHPNEDLTIKNILKEILSPQDNLYHYTSIKAFNSILKTQELWFSDITETNDKTELIYFLDVIQKQVPTLIKSTGCFQIKQQNEAFFNELFESAKDEVLSTKSYMLSLTTHGDTFAMWDSSYGDQCQGICIRFNKFNLLKILNHNFLFNQVFYGDEIIKRHQLFNIGTYIFNNGSLPPRYINTDVFVTDLIMCSRFFKNYSFRLESEYRFITLSSFKNYRIGQEANINCKNKLKANFASLCAKNNIKIDDLFDEIIIGPKCNTSVEYLQSEISALGFSDLSKKIKLSSCPVR